MFRSLRLKLTLINTFVVGFILLFIFSGIYIMMKNGMAAQSERIMISIAHDDDSRSSRFFGGQRRAPGSYFYVISRDNGRIQGTSNDAPYSSEELSELARETLSSAGDKGYVKMNGEKFRFLKAGMRSSPGSVKIVFYNLQPENEITTRLITTLLAVGLAAMTLGFFSSLFMANRALIPIKESWENQKAFVADASHELRTPLAVIQTNLELVMGNQSDTVESQMKWLENIQAESRTMSKLVNDLLFLARADSNTDNTSMENFPLDLMLRDTVETFEPLARAKGLTLDHELEAGIMFYGSESRIRQLLAILLDNALKYTPSGGSIHVLLKSKENTLELSVSDTGEGIPREHSRKIFERFYRVETSRTRESGGSGLGLSIADCIVKEHHGSISVSSTPGKGSTFKVVLPNKRH